MRIESAHEGPAVVRIRRLAFGTRDDTIWLVMSEKDDIESSAERIWTEDSIRQEFEGTLHERVERYLQVKPINIIPNAPFAPVSSECAKLFRDGYSYACISLAQAVAEGIVRYVLAKNSCEGEKVFEKGVDKLHKRKFISDEVKEALLKIWENRDDYHHLNDTVESDRQKLEELAREKAHALNDVESYVFGYSIRDDGALVPYYPKYWDISGSEGNVFLRFDV